MVQEDSKTGSGHKFLLETERASQKSPSSDVAGEGPWTLELVAFKLPPKAPIMRSVADNGLRRRLGPQLLMTKGQLL